MGCNKSKPKDDEKEPVSLSDQYADVIPFDSVGGDFDGSGTMFYEDISDIAKSVPYLNAHPELEITVEVYLECPRECNKQRCGQCTKDQCNNGSIADEQCQTIESILAKQQCATHVNKKFRGCLDETIQKDIIKIYISEKEEKKPESVPPTTVVDTKAIDEENAKKEAALAKREAALQAAEALLAKKMSEVDKDRDEVAQEKQRLLDTKKQLQAVEDEQEEQRIANETATQEAERKRKAFELAQKIAEEKAKEADKALKLADKKKAEYEEALAVVEQEREAENAKIKAIMYDIEMTLKEEIEFVQNKAELTAIGKGICDKVLPLLLKLPDMKINIESHTNCKKGRCDDGCHLMDLSQDRVDTVKFYFVERGATNEFHTKGWGCRHPELKNVRKVRIYPDHAHRETVHLPAH
mmetsp:Transcript_17982/g.30084  ORF Transcript_17982/g.30084 Transcript_17982/m.30084 type:complete len:411 (-) Transcript_17982:1063-2295(-)